jgi:hypothetical protein
MLEKAGPGCFYQHHILPHIPFQRRFSGGFGAVEKVEIAKCTVFQQPRFVLFQKAHRLQDHPASVARPT